ncbi:MAG TPA: hypothetical protein VEL70_00765 [Candidatus Acidoferrum sp.]|nr:hypothetical protein [Candidatus Acidoferrum sp.]
MKLNVRIPIAASRKISVAVGTGVIFLVIIDLLMTPQILPYTNDIEVFMFILTVIIAYGIGSWILLGHTRGISNKNSAKSSNVTSAITNASTLNISEKETPDTMIQTLIEKLQAAGATVGTTITAERRPRSSSLFINPKSESIFVNGKAVRVLVFEDDFSDEVTNSLINYLLSDCNSSEHYVGVGSGIPIYHHFYKCSKLIADYVGNTPSTMSILAHVLGKQLQRGES